MRDGSKSHCEETSSNWVASGVFESNFKSEKLEDLGRVYNQIACVKWPRPSEYCHRKKEVIIGRDFILVNRKCIRSGIEFGEEFPVFSYAESLSC